MTGANETDRTAETDMQNEMGQPSFMPRSAVVIVAFVVALTLGGPFLFAALFDEASLGVYMIPTLVGAVPSAVCILGLWQWVRLDMAASKDAAIHSISDDGRWLTSVRPVRRGFKVEIHRIGGPSYDDVLRGDG